MRPWIVAAVSLLIACGDRDDDAPRPPDVAIAVTVMGATASPIRAADLSRAKPRARDATGAGWLLADVLPLPWPDGATVTAVGKNGVRVAYRNPADRDLLTLFALSSGEAYLARAELGAMFDPNAGGPPNPATRVGALAEIRIGDAPGAPADAGPPPSIRVTAAGGDTETWSLERLAQLPGATATTFPVPALAAAIGATGTLDISTATGSTAALTPAALADPAAQPRLRLNRRGKLKLETVDAAGERVSGPKLRDVTAIRARPAQR